MDGQGVKATGDVAILMGLLPDDASWVLGSPRAFLSSEKPLWIKDGFSLEHEIHGTTQFVRENGHRLRLVVFVGHVFQVYRRF